MSIMQLRIYLSKLFLPAFINRSILFFTANPDDRPKPQLPRATAYLDGLRGVAALIVYIFHWSYLWFPQLRYGYGVNNNKLFWQLPVIRALHSGRSSVTVFFVISGFVLSIKTLKLIHQRKDDQVLSALSGSSFRRPFRLYLPIIVSTLIIAFIVYAGWYKGDPSGAPIPPKGATLDQQLRHWFWSTIDIINPFHLIDNRRNMSGSIYNGHLWTIPVEFKGSLLVFILLLIFARAKRWIHAVAVTGVAFWLVFSGDFDQALFAIGLLLAELSIIRPPNAFTATTPENAILDSDIRIPNKFSAWPSKIVQHVVTVALLFLALHFISYPEIDGASTPGYIALSQKVPAYYLNNSDRNQQYWNSVGSVMLIIALMYSPTVSLTPMTSWAHRKFYFLRRHINLDLEVQKEPLLSEYFVENEAALEPLLQRPFTTSFAQFLGQISYSFYLWHGTIIHTVGAVWMNPASVAWDQAVKEIAALVVAGNDLAADKLRWKASTAYYLAFFLGTLINTLGLLWVSDVFNRLVDVPAVRFTRWISKKAWTK